MPRRLKLDMDPANTSLTRYASNATGATWALAQTTPGDSLARVVTIRNDAAVDHSAKTAILTGTDADGRAQTETVNLPGVSATITSTKHFLTLTTVVPSATIGGDTMDIGIGDDIVSKTVPLNHWSEVACGFMLDVTGTIDVDVELTFDPPNQPNEFTWTDQGTPVWMNSTNVAAATADVFTTLDQNAYAARVRINTYTDTAELQAWFSQTERQ